MKTRLVLIFSLVTATASAQYFDKMFFFGWTVNQPVLNTDFVGRTSTRGARFGYRELINEKVALGADLTFATYDDYVPRQTYYSPAGALTTDFNNYANNYGATIAGEYYFHAERKVMPYVGFGAGVAYNSYKIYYNVYSTGDNVFGALLRPRAGVWVKFNNRNSWGFHAAVHLEYSTNKSPDMGYKGFLNPGLELGLVRLDW